VFGKRLLPFVRPDQFFTAEGRLESGIVADWIPHWINLQLVDGNVKADRHRQQLLRRFHG
jgi:hypothetical protein